MMKLPLRSSAGARAKMCVDRNLPTGRSGRDDTFAPYDGQRDDGFPNYGIPRLVFLLMP
jgi:hypothetical protein